MKKIKMIFLLIAMTFSFSLMPIIKAEELTIIDCEQYGYSDKLPTDVLDQLDNIIPDKIKVDITKTDYVNNLVNLYESEFVVGNDLLVQTLHKQIIELLMDNGIQVINSVAEQNISTSFWDGLGKLDFASFGIGDFNKEFAVEFAKESNYNTADEAYVKNKVSKIKYDKYYDIDAVITLYNVGDYKSANKWTINTYNLASLINDKLITYKITDGAGGMGGGTPWGTGTNIYFMKNGVVYYHKYIMNIGAYGTILSNGVKANIATIEKDDDYNDIYKTMASEFAKKKITSIINCYDVTPFLPVNGKVSIDLTVDSKYNGKPVKVLQKRENNTYTTINSTVVNGKVNISVTDVESSYMIALDNNRPITSVKINQSNLVVVINKTAKLTATINPSNTTQSKTLTWSSSNTKIATVDKNGVVKGIKAGTANITVKTGNGKTATVKVTVKKATPIKSVKLNKKSAKLELNKTLQLKATINPSGTTDSKTLTWSTSNKKVATVDKNGKVTAVGSGTAKITVKTSNGKKATVKITVSKINAKKAKITAIANQTQTGKAIKPGITVTLNGKTLKSGTDYTVSYKNNKNAGKATVTVKFKGNYTGSVKSTFSIIPKKVAIENPSTTKKAITVKYTKVSGAKTYQIAYRIKGTDKWSYTTSTSASKKISKLTTGKEYEVCVRAGIKSGSKTLYGAWSDIKTITVK